MAMLPFRSILCPVDYSAHAAHAQRHAASLAALARARLVIIKRVDEKTRGKVGINELLRDI